MKTLERWWTPDGQISAEDLLKAGPDPKKDLGIALLALHRAGAEACDLVAKTAVADEHVLVAAIAETRALMAPLAVEVVSKAVESPQYAGLLLKDLLDDAEVAALALYRTCLAKSVAPPIAAERVGAVYGVSSRAMGRYAHLASDPKANPRAVQDLADRTLFDYVSKVVEEEYVPAKEPFSKASQTPYEDAKNVEHGPGGRYVREGSPEVASLNRLFAEAEARVAAPKEVAPEREDATTTPAVGGPRVMRTMRQMRTMRTMKAPVEEPEKLKAEQLRGERLDLSIFAERLSPEQLRVFDYQEPPTPMPLAGKPRAVPDLKKHRGTGGGAALTKPVSFIMTDNELIALGSAATDVGGHHVMRVGGLEEYAGQARIYSDDGKTTTREHMAGVEHVLEQVLKDESFKDQPDLKVGTVPIQLLEDTNNYMKALQEAKKTFVRMEAAKLGITVNVETEIVNVKDAVLRTDKSLVALIWRPPGEDRQGRRLQTRPVPAVVEVVVHPKAQVAGKISGTRVELDGDDPIKVRSLFRRHPSGGLRQTFWDPDLGALRTVVIAESAGEDEISKADSQYLDIHNVENGPSGRFVREGTKPTPVNTAALQALFDQAKAREDEPVRRAKVRTMRTARTMRTMQTKPLEQLSGEKLKGEVLAAEKLVFAIGKETLKRHKLAREALKDKDPSELEHLLFLQDDLDYTVMQPHHLATVLELSGTRVAVDEGTVVELSGSARRFLAELDAMEGDQAQNELLVGNITTWNRRLRHDTAEAALGPSTAKGTRRVLTHTLTDVDEIDVIARFIHDQIERDPGLSLLKARMDIQKDGRVQLVVSGNAEVLPEMHVVDLSDAYGDDAKRLVAGGTKRMQNHWSIAHHLRLLHDSMEHFGGHAEDTISNPQVRTWRAE